MIDLRVLRDRWTEDGAREIFAQLVTHCVRALHPSAQAVRPDPGDEGLDTFVGEFNSELHVYQAKYFCDGVGDSQKRQIRESWRSCQSSARFTRVASWTLCIPIELSAEEHEWWQKWQARQASAHDCQLALWSKSQFEAFSVRPELVALFDRSLSRGGGASTVAGVLADMALHAPARPVVSLPTEDHHRNALFVRKLELAGWVRHRSARTAFYNFELLRTAVEQGGTESEMEALVDLRERVFQLWEHAYNEHTPERLGRALVAEVERRVNAEHRGLLQCVLPAAAMHKLGAVHDWADHCLAGWTADFDTVAYEASS